MYQGNVETNIVFGKGFVDLSQPGFGILAEIFEDI